MNRFTNGRREASGAFQIFQHELNRLLDDYLQPDRRGERAPSPSDPDATTWSPAIDVYESTDEMIVVIEVPGIEPSKVDLAVTGRVLSVRGVKEPDRLPEAVLRLGERRFGPFHREVSLPHDVDFDRAHAQVGQGTLTVRLPKRSATAPRTIPIRPG